MASSYTHASPIGRHYPAARLNWLEEGPPTVHGPTIARHVLDGHAPGQLGHDPTLAPPR